MLSYTTKGSMHIQMLILFQVSKKLSYDKPELVSLVSYIN